MADTYTPNYTFILVEVGASRDTWGAKTNQNMTAIDTNLKSLQTQITNNTNSINSNTTAITNTNNAFKAWMPIGIVCLWTVSGSPPAGWAICDGRTVVRTDGGGNLTTPNMMARFILADPVPGQLGGNYTGSATTSSVGNHSHGGGTGGFALTINEMPAHTHTIPDNLVRTGTGNHFSIGGGDAVIPNSISGSTGNGAAHAHSIGADGAHSHTVTMTIVPNYFTAIYIMRY